MCPVVLEAVQVLVSLATDLAPVRFLLLHAQSSGIRRGSLWVDD